MMSSTNNPPPAESTIIQVLRVLPSSSLSNHASATTITATSLESIDISVDASKRTQKYSVLIPFCIGGDYDPVNKKTALISIDNGTSSVKVGEPLANAMRHLEGKWLWVWGICDDDAEKRRSQVQQAAAVFENAARIYCYLPVDGVGTASPGQVSVLAALAGMLTSKSGVGLLQLDSGKEVEWKAKVLEKAVGVKFEEEERVIRRLRKRRKVEKDADMILEVLDALRGFGCDDPRGRVCLTPGVEALRLVPDFESPVENVYVEFAKRLIQGTGNLDVLNWVRATRTCEGGWPSWVPRWMESVDASCVTAHPLLGDWSEGGYRSYCASGTLMKAQIRDVLTGDDTSPGTITLSGIRFDEADKMESPWHPATDPSFGTGKRWEELTLEELPEHISCPYGGLDGRKAALQKVFVAAGNKLEGRHGPLSTARSRLLRGSSSRQDLNVPSPTNSQVYHACAHRRLVVTKKGYLGLAPANAETGDVIVVLYGGKTPYLLRLVSLDDEVDQDRRKVTYQLVGELYVAGMMEGEVMSWEHAGACMREFRIC
ncbi:hypothetical protein QBC43DRAFT_68352 [Cladorrhinum sp. PSN259]|nr:hypothetical protein QBC43DRAFT_68352 [Cladorrhinum sp. PSN259]